MLRSIGLLVFMLALGGCRGWTTDDAPVVPIRNMYDQPRYDSQERRPFFEDQRSMRPQVPGTISREMERDLSYATGRLVGDEGWVMNVPNVVAVRSGGASAMVERGQDRYNIYCATCHSRVGDGMGSVAIRAGTLGALALKPPTFHSDRLRHVPDGQIFSTITNGVRNMPAYGFSIPGDDRWAIVSYVRALQLTQLQSAANTTEQEK